MNQCNPENPFKNSSVQDGTAASPACNSVRWDKYAPIVLAIMASILMIWGLNNTDLTGHDEPRYAQISREMVEDGDYLVLHLNGQKYSNKPPMYFWLVAAFSTIVGGVNEVSSRMPSALAGVATVLLVYTMGKRMFGARTGFIAGLVLVSSIYFVLHSRSVHMDLPLTFTVTAMMAAFYVAHERGRAEWWTWPILFLMGALGILIKGPAGFIPPLLACAAVSLLTRQRRVWNISILWGIALFVAVVGVWLALLWRHTDSRYVWNIAVTQTLGRVKGEGSHVQPFYFYLQEFPAIFMPWTPLFCIALVKAGQRAFHREAGRGLLFVLAWFTVVFISFSVVPTKRTMYLLPVFPAAALLVAWFLNSLMEGKAAQWAAAAAKWVTALPLLLVAAAAPLALLFLAWGRLSGDSRAISIFEDLRRNYVAVSSISILLCVQGVVGAQAALRKYWPGVVTVMMLMCIAAGVFAVFIYFPLANKFSTERNFALKLNEMAGGSEVAVYGEVPEGVVFYSHRAVKILKTAKAAAAYLNAPGADPKFCLVWTRDLSQIRDACKYPSMLEQIYKEDLPDDELLLLLYLPSVQEPGQP